MYDEKLVEDSLAFAEEIRARLEGKKAAAGTQEQNSRQSETVSGSRPGQMAASAKPVNIQKTPVTKQPGAAQVQPQTGVKQQSAGQPVKAPVQPQQSVKPQVVPQKSANPQAAQRSTVQAVAASQTQAQQKERLQPAAKTMSAAAQTKQSVKPQAAQRPTAQTVTASQVQAQQNIKPQHSAGQTVQTRQNAMPQMAQKSVKSQPVSQVETTPGQPDQSVKAQVAPQATATVSQIPAQQSAQPQPVSQSTPTPARLNQGVKPQAAPQRTTVPAAEESQIPAQQSVKPQTAPQSAATPVQSQQSVKTQTASQAKVTPIQSQGVKLPTATASQISTQQSIQPQAVQQATATASPSQAVQQPAATASQIPAQQSAQPQAASQATATASQMQPHQSAQPQTASQAIVPQVQSQQTPDEVVSQQRILPEGQINRQSIPDTAPGQMAASGAAAADIRTQTETGNAEVPKVETPPKKEHLISVSTSTSRPIRPKTSALDTISEETRSMDAPEEQDHTVEITIKLDVAGIKKKFSDLKKKLAPEERTLEQVNAAMEENRHLQAEKQQEKTESAAEKGARLAQKTAAAASGMGKKLSGMIHKKPEEAAATMEMDGVISAEAEAQAVDGEIVQLEGEAVEENRFAEKLNDLKEVIPQKAGKVSNWVTTVVIVAFCIGIAYFLASFVTTYVAHQTTVEGESMEPTLTDGDSVIIQRLSYYFTDPKRYDVVVFPVNYDDGTSKKTYYIKRVIGLPGETVQIIDGSVYINNEKLDDDVYGAATINEAGIAENPLVLGENQYFVMGDNRNMSTDSRNSYVGLVNKNDIIGEAWLCTWPLNHFGGVKK